MINAPRPLFFRGPSVTVRLCVAVVACIVLMTADHRYKHLADIRSVLATVVYPVQKAAHMPVEFYAWAQESLASRQALLEVNAELRRKELLFASRLEKFAELEAENRRLRQLLDSSTKVADRVLIAELLSVDMDPFSRRILLDKGANDGVQEGQSLIDANGIMGQIVHTGAVTSQALLITDPSHALPAQINRTGLRCIAVGTGSSDVLELKHIPLNEDVRVGDLVVTSGLGGRFQRGYPVGRVISVERDSAQSFATVRVKPAAALERNREVLLVWPGDEPLPGPPPQDKRRRAS
ncbi:MAG: rod shape-determining protein MreC [Pseudomonadota bacterium]